MMNDSSSRRIHDLKGAYLDFRAVFNLLQSGYRFEGDEAKKVLEQFEKALNIFRAEVERAEKERAGE